MIQLLDISDILAERRCELCDADYKSPGYDVCSVCRQSIAERRKLSDSPWTKAAVAFFGHAFGAPVLGLELERAAEEGRLHPDIAAHLGVATGEHSCHVCGMLFWTRNEADLCCANAPQLTDDERAACERRMWSIGAGVESYER